jgi:hypothetical protein
MLFDSVKFLVLGRNLLGNHFLFKSGDVLGKFLH